MMRVCSSRVVEDDHLQSSSSAISFSKKIQQEAGGSLDYDDDQNYTSILLIINGAGAGAGAGAGGEEEEEATSAVVTTTSVAIETETETETEGEELIWSREGGGGGDQICKTPTEKEFKIPEILICPPAPRKQRREEEDANCFSRRQQQQQRRLQPNLEAMFAIDNKKSSFVHHATTYGGQNAVTSNTPSYKY